MYPNFANANDNKDETGLYMWDLSTDTLYADGALAALFGLDKQQAERGLPLNAYVDRIHVEDRALVADAIREAIISGQPFQETYRVHNSTGTAVRVLAFGRCFRDAEEQPRFYSGIVFPMPAEQTGDNSLIWQCLSALELAKRDGRADVSALLIQAIERLDNPTMASAPRLCA